MSAAHALLDDLAQALLDEERARAEVQAAVGRQADLLRDLRRLGVPATRVAQKVASSLGHPLPVGDRLRLARRLRKRAERETARRADLVAPSGHLVIAASPSDRALPPQPEEENVMPKLIKRTVVEEYVEDEAKDAERDEDADDQEEDEEEDGADEPESHSRKR